ncbi:DsbA family oxidoreductase [Nocardiopsis metallicus]|uniref:Putative DsbA family dithiol-disulfide isomerase n=1 Tax=Nocardiopsis metallicus TaxID=179819 RepID=A0A840WQG8_9ACTN|nr:DsbA family protein [Nocardiopsis metallicus]MBB5492368.1 putative DsbA family dithiol-disulfide isomerase [Nocardiopsis metallicus]
MDMAGEGSENSMDEITVWADIRCPWCWMGHRRLKAALERLGAAGREVTVVRRSFLLEPAGPDSPDRTVRGAALNSWGTSQAQWEATRSRVAEASRREGLGIEMNEVLNVGSRPAHRLIKLAVSRGFDPGQVWDQLYTAHLERREDLTAPEALRRAGKGFGLAEGDVDALLDSDDFAAEVEADHREAVAQGVGSIPTYAHAGQALSGARSVDELVEFLSGAEARR